MPTTTIDFVHLGIATVLKRFRLTVPLNQREFSWRLVHVEKLFQDLAAAIEANKPSYFLGTIVLTRGETGELELADGQQRLVTVSILLAAIRDYFCEIDDRLLITSVEELLMTIVREKREERPRLVLNADDHEFYRARILRRPEEKERKRAVATKLSHERIESAARAAAKHVQAVIKQFSPSQKIDVLNHWVAFLEDAAQVILITATDDANAYVMFETLNDRGLRTNQADLVKNYLFREAGDRLREAQQRWSSMKGTLETLGRDVTLTYLRHLAISKYGYTIEREVYERIEQKVRGKLHAIQFLDSLAETANDYVAILNPLHTKWNAYETSVREYVRTLYELPVKNLRPLMLAVATTFSKKQAALTLRMFVHWAVRLLVAGNARSGSVEQAFAEQAKEVTAGRAKSAADLLKALQSTIPSDAEFQDSFAKERVSSSPLARYYLRCLELKKQDRPEPEWIPNDDVVVNLEHILPENPGDGWGEFDSETAPSYHRRLGNMVLLQASKNSLIGNGAFSEKKKILRESTFQLTSEVAQEKEWGPKQIDKRQSRLAELAVKTWPLSPR